MKVTKLIHSCLLIEQNGQKILVDPGSYSWQDEAVKTYDFSGISTVVITHNHPDHISNDFAEAVHTASPNAIWYGTQQAADQLATITITVRTSSDDPTVRFIDSAHADLSPWFSEQPEHTSYVLFGDILVTGDCQSLTDMHGAHVLAGAINGGPWGAVVGFAKMVQAMPEPPTIVLPLHDWHWNDSARKAIYEQLTSVLAAYDTTFVPLENGVTHTL